MGVAWARMAGGDLVRDVLAVRSGCQFRKRRIWIISCWCFGSISSCSILLFGYRITSKLIKAPRCISLWYLIWGHHSWKQLSFVPKKFLLHVHCSFKDLGIAHLQLKMTCWLCSVKLARIQHALRSFKVFSKCPLYNAFFLVPGECCKKLSLSLATRVCSTLICIKQFCCFDKAFADSVASEWTK